MSDSLHQQLLGYLLGVLDDEEQRALEARLEQDEACRRELAAWRRRLTPLEVMRPEFEPPAALTERTCRFVTSCLPTLAQPRSSAQRWRMSPSPAPPSRVGRVGWLDIAVVALLLVTAGALVSPAIHSSRFQARLVSCQDSLREFGSALSQYGQQHGTTLSRLAGDGKLTGAGVVAASLLNDACLTDRRRPVCSETWLAAQGAPLCEPSGGADRPTITMAGLVEGDSPGLRFAQPRSRGDFQWCDDWPGTWRNGTTDGLRPRSPADAPLLADAPSADLPGQPLESHGGRGRNMLFMDGRVEFLPCAVSREVADPLFSSGDTLRASHISAPLIFVNGR